MSNAWFEVFTIIGGINVVMISVFAYMLSQFKKEMTEKFKLYCESSSKDFCNLKTESSKDRLALWRRVNHHLHNGEGRVVITDKE